MQTKSPRSNELYASARRTLEKAMRNPDKFEQAPGRQRPPVVDRLRQLTRTRFSEFDAATPQIRPFLFEVDQRFGKAQLSFADIFRLERLFFFALVDDTSKIFRDPLAQPKTSVLGCRQGRVIGTGMCTTIVHHSVAAKPFKTQTCFDFNALRRDW